VWSKKEKINSGSKDQKLAQSVQQLEESIKTSKDDYDKTTDNVKEGLSDYHRQRKFEMTDALKKLAQINMEYHMKVANLWKKFFIELETEDNDNE